MDLQQELQNYLNGVIENTPIEIMGEMQQFAQELLDKKVGNEALSKGDKLPNFTLANALGEEKNIYDLLENGPLIINYYRGAWCPYCNLELRAYNEVLEEIKNAGGNLVSISPELPDESMSLIEKHNLKFEVLSDLNNKVARDLGLVFKLSDTLVEIYKSFGIDFDKAQGNTDKEIPIPATYVVNTDGTIVLSSIDTDYTKRLEPSIAIEELKKL